MFRLLVFIFCLHPLFAEEGSGHKITYREALAKVLGESPDLKESFWNVMDKDGDSVQSALYPNPYFSYSVENVLGNKEWEGFKSAESRYEFNQPLLIGGQREYRANAALLRYYASISSYEADKIRLLNQLQKGFIEAAKQQELFEIAKRQYDLAKGVLSSVLEKVEAGKVSKVEQNKAEISLAEVEIFCERAKIRHQIAMERLALLWGSCCQEYDGVEFDFYNITEPPQYDVCLDELSEHPLLITSQFEAEAERQETYLASRERIPDVTVTVGVKTVRNTHEKGMILGASLPLPLYDRNQGKIRSRTSTYYLAEERYLKLKAQLIHRLKVQHKELMQAYLEVDRFKNTVLLTASKSFDFAKEGYDEGKFEYLDVLDSQKTLFAVQERYIEALSNYHERLAEIEYLNVQEL